jgi:hypothetical protein
MLGGERRARVALTPALALLAHLPLLHGWGSAPGLRAPWAHPVLVGRRSPALGGRPGVSLYAARGHHPPSKRTPPPPPPKHLPTASNPFDIPDELKSQEVIEKEEWEVKKGRCAPPPLHLGAGRARAATWCAARVAGRTARVRRRPALLRGVGSDSPPRQAGADAPRVRVGPRRAVEQRFTRTNGTMTTLTSCRATASSTMTPRWKYTQTHRFIHVLHTFIHPCMHACMHACMLACIHTYVPKYKSTHKTHAHTGQPAQDEVCL